MTGPANSADGARVQRAALRVGVSVGAASAAIVGLITVITVAAVLASSRPRPGDDGPGRHDEVLERVVDVSDVLPVAVALGIAGVIVLGLIAWYAARRAATPLAEALAVQRAFVADASHELRTPLTALTSRIQLAQRRQQRGDDVTAVLQDLRRDAASLNDVLTDLLTAAETAGARAVREDASAVVADAIGAAMETIRPRADEAGVRLTAAADPRLRAGIEQAALTRAILALLDNAVRHSPAGGLVAVSAEPSARRVEIRVSDQGAGISGIDPARVFDRFAHASGDGPGRGFGLGLALVRDIADRFGGTVEVESTSTAGTTFRIILPSARA
jgi:signal transduction histidine kinase